MREEESLDRETSQGWRLEKPPEFTIGRVSESRPNPTACSISVLILVWFIRLLLVLMPIKMVVSSQMEPKRHWE